MIRICFKICGYCTESEDVAALKGVPCKPTWNFRTEYVFS